MYRFGTDFFPSEKPEYYKWQPHSDDATFKGIQLLAFVRDSWSPVLPAEEEEDEEELAEVIPRWAALDVCAPARQSLSPILFLVFLSPLPRRH